MATRYGIIRDGELVEEFDAEELTERCRNLDMDYLKEISNICKENNIVFCADCQII